MPPPQQILLLTAAAASTGFTTAIYTPTTLFKLMLLQLLLLVLGIEKSANLNWLLYIESCYVSFFYCYWPSSIINFLSTTNNSILGVNWKFAGELVVGRCGVVKLMSGCQRAVNNLISMNWLSNWQIFMLAFLISVFSWKKSNWFFSHVVECHREQR